MNKNVSPVHCIISIIFVCLIAESTTGIPNSQTYLKLNKWSVLRRACLKECLRAVDAPLTNMCVIPPTALATMSAWRPTVSPTTRPFKIIRTLPSISGPHHPNRAKLKPSVVSFYALHPDFCCVCVFVLARRSY